MGDGPAKRLSECRERSGLSLAELSGRTGLSRSHLSGTHSGAQPISLEALEKLKAPYGTTVEWLRDGDPRVDAWSEYQMTDSARQVGGPAASTEERVRSLITFLERRYPGHLTRQDIAHYLGVSISLVQDLLNGRRTPTEDFCKALSELSGVSVGWLQVGNVDSLAGLGMPGTMTADKLRQWLSLAMQAEQLGVSVDEMKQFLSLAGKLKGGA